MVGETLGKYRLIAPLGRGGMGTVYRAVDETLDREVAIKVLSPDLAESDVVQRFRSEAIALARLNHRDIATIYELYRSGSDLLMVMEFVRGETLDKILERTPQLSLEHAVSIVDRLLGALEHAHRAGIVHRDLKPGNVMITDDGGIKIMDFGIARIVGTDHGTRDGFLLGTPSYMSPEQVLGHKVDGRSDLYSIGVMFYRLLTGAVPFTGETVVAIAHKQVLETAPPLTFFRQGLPDWCETILTRALEKAPANRFQTADEFRVELANATGTLVTEQLHALPAVSLPTETLAEIAPKAPAPAAGGNKTLVLAYQPSARAALLTPAAIAICVLTLGDVRPAVPWTHGIPVTPSRSRVSALLASTAPTLPKPAPLPAATALVIAPPAIVEQIPTSGAAPTQTGDASEPPRNEARAGRAWSTAVLPPLVFDVAAVVGSGADQRERKAQALLANGTLTVIGEDRTVVQTLPYERLDSISYSRGKNPVWKSSSGPVEIARVKDGKFGFLKGDRHWITLRTAGTFLVLRVDQGHASKLLDALQERTGQQPIYILD